MTELVAITLENEMDLTLAYKRSILTAGLLGLTVATQTAFATAVSEVCREIIDKATNGIARLGCIADSGRFSITAVINCDIDEDFNKHTGGFEYARKLLPVVELESKGNNLTVTLRLGIPHSARIDQVRIAAVKRRIEADGPVSAYEEVKQRNAALSDLNQQQEIALTEANYLNEQKNEFLSVASHELNSPLTILQSYAQIAQRMVGDSNSPLHKPIAKINQQSSKLVSLIRQLMDITKIEHGEFTYEMQPVDFNTFLRDVLESAEILVPNHHLIVNLGSDVRVNIDKLRMEQVLTNLISNAAKYSESGSQIAITTFIEADKVICRIQDQGIGISREAQKSIFDKFYREKIIEKKYSGLGMGLYIASRIANDHQGTIQVESKQGEGSVFSVTLPLASA